jgi:hypothetical protein
MFRAELWKPRSGLEGNVLVFTDFSAMISTETHLSWMQKGKEMICGPKNDSTV